MKVGSPVIAMIRVGVVGSGCGTVVPWQILLPLPSDYIIYPASASIRQKEKERKMERKEKTSLLGGSFVPDFSIIANRMRISRTIRMIGRIKTPW